MLTTEKENIATPTAKITELGKKIIAKLKP